MYNVKDFGAIGDGAIVDTQAVQRAIDKCFDDGGGTVLFPQGKYICSTIIMKSHVHICLEKDAVICVDSDFTHYEQNVLIYAADAEDISITGEGEILGNGQEDWGLWWGITTPRTFRIKLLIFENCKDILIENVSFLYSDSWTIHLFSCENVKIDGVKILNNFRHLNSDGIDPDCCKNVTISNCRIIAGDDCIVAKTTKSGIMSNLVVRNCVLETPNTAIKIGTESNGDFCDIDISGCVINKAAVGIGIFVKDGGTVKNVRFSNISIKNLDIEHIKPVLPLIIDIEKRHADSKLGKVENIAYENIKIETTTGALFQGMPEQKLKDISLENIDFHVTALQSFENRKKAITGNTTLQNQQETTYIRKPSYMSFANIDRLCLENIKLFIDTNNADECDKAVVYLKDVSDFKTQSIARHPNMENRIIIKE